MSVKKVNLINFRNYTKAEVETNSNLVLILGNNATGKTNFLESIYYLSRLKSFRAPDQFLVRNSANFFTIQGTVKEKQLEAVVQIYPSTKRQFKIDGVKTKKSFWQSFRTVLFVPNDLNLFILGPVARRKLMDEILSQKSKEYELALVSLDHVLVQKAALLEQINQGMGDVVQLDFWNEQLAEAGLKIFELRQQLSDFINERFNLVQKDLAGFQSSVLFNYKSQLHHLNKAELVDRLNQSQQAEIRSMKNLIGPHRDDFVLEKEGIENIYNSSRGELRSHILTLKLLQAEYLITETERPVILLDDVFSELDETRRNKLIESLTGHQIFITSTEEHHLPKLNQSSLVLKVENNAIIN